MFGLLYVFSELVGLTVSGTKRMIDNAILKEQGWEKYNNKTDMGSHTYYDAEGKERDLITNHIMFTYRNNGDVYIKDTKTSQIRNLSEEKRLEKIKEIKKTNSDIKAIYYKFWNHSNSELKDGEWGISGDVYRDINNGELYFERYITWRKNDFSKAGILGDRCSAYFYLRISDGKIVCISDKQKENDRRNNVSINYDEFINFFNSEQEKGGFVVRNRNPYAKKKEHFYLGNESICNNR